MFQFDFRQKDELFQKWNWL